MKSGRKTNDQEMEWRKKDEKRRQQQQHQPSLIPLSGVGYMDQMMS